MRDGHVWQSSIHAKSVGLHSMCRGIVLHVDGPVGASGFVLGGILLSGWLDKLTGRDLERYAARLSKRRILSEWIVGTDGVSAQHVSAEHGTQRHLALLGVHARVVLRVVQSYGAYGSVLSRVLLHEQLVNLESVVVVNELVHGAVVRYGRFCNMIADINMFDCFDDDENMFNVF